MKKAQGLSFNTIIIAALALVVMVVVFFIFNQGVSPVPENLNSCKAKGGECQPTCGKERPVKLLLEECTAKEEVCCIPFGNQKPDAPQPLETESGEPNTQSN